MPDEVLAAHTPIGLSRFSVADPDGLEFGGALPGFGKLGWSEEQLHFPQQAFAIFVSALGGDGGPLAGGNLIARDPFVLVKQKGQAVLSPGVALLGGAGEPLGGFRSGGRPPKRKEARRLLA